ncbi:DsbA family protein [Arcanobacterium ihumii]|uniref:DsbA family protein n=1 Tax=Arcanobacterium ihumii TaxID=2138162 RepID=UPI000F52091F|nr:thioredoxin domain-containing protein [Arcanobacterium ihumii]
MTNSDFPQDSNNTFQGEAEATKAKVSTPIAASSPTAKATPNTQRNGTNKALLIIVVALLAVVVLLTVLLFSRNGDADQSDKNAETSQSAQQGTQKQGSGTDESQQEKKPKDGAPAPAVPDDVRKIIDSQHRLTDGDPRAKGGVNARVVVEIYADFRCGHCANFALNVEPQLKKMIDDGTIRYEFNSLPVLGADSVMAAQAAQAAANQGMFWEYHDALYEAFAKKSATYSVDGLTDLAKKAGVKDLEKFRADITAPQTVEAVKKEMDNGRRLGLTGTPAFLIGYQFVPGDIPFDTFKQIVDSELKREKAA